jgi:hypothetical protein
MSKIMLTLKNGISLAFDRLKNGIFSLLDNVFEQR